VKRAVVLAVLAGLVIAAAYGYSATRRERMFREYVARGEAALSRSDPSAAVADFSVSIALKPETMLGYLKRGEAYRQHGDLDAALKDLSQAARLDPASPRALELLGDVHLAKGRFDRAVEHFQTSTTLDDRSPRVLYKLGLALQSASRADAAIAALKRALALQQQFPEAHYLLALCHRDLHQDQEARRALEAAIRMAPTLLAAREELAALHGRAGRVNSRIAQLEALVSIDPAPRRHVVLALALAAAGRIDRAVITLRAAIDRFPDDGAAYVALGQIWLDGAEADETGTDLQKALEALERAAGLEDSSEALTLLGRALLLSADQKLAEQLLQRATEKLPVENTAFLYLAEAAERNGRIERARRALLDYNALEGGGPGDPRDARVCERIGNLSLRLDDPVAAAAWYRRALALHGGDGPLSLAVRLAEAQWKSGDAAEARRTLRTVLERDPAHDQAHALLRRVR
jgi:tetratricopeptide (TPR) repeat protein